MKFLIDLVLLLIIIGFTVVGFRKGFVKMALAFFKNIIAFLAAYIFCTPFAQWLKEQFFMEKAKLAIERKVADFLGANSATGSDIAPLLDSEHSGFASFIEKMGIDVDTINALYRNSDGSISEAVSEYIAEPCVTALSTALAFILIFIGTLILLKIASALLGLVTKLPIIKGTNRLLGALLGIILGVFWAFVATALIRLVVPYFSDSAVVASLNDGATLYNMISSIAPTFLSSIL
jgi:uncharacterized membrane protein required for colicin V production